MNRLQTLKNVNKYHYVLLDIVTSYEESLDNLERTTPLETSAEAEDDELPYVLTKLKPKHKWNAVKEFTLRYCQSHPTLYFLIIKICHILFRSFGLSCHKNIENVFNGRCYGSRRFVERLELAYKMDCHNGCVNALHFNTSGTRLASGSDDLTIIIWDWTQAKPVLNYDSGHRGNVFQVCTVPTTGHHLVSLFLLQPQNSIFLILFFN